MIQLKIKGSGRRKDSPFPFPKSHGILWGRFGCLKMRKIIMNPDKLREFYDPHTGHGGTVLHIPSELQRVANELNGNTLSLLEAIARIRAVTNGQVEIHEKSKFLSLTLRSANQSHYFRIISFR